MVWELEQGGKGRQAPTLLGLVGPPLALARSALQARPPGRGEAGVGRGSGLKRGGSGWWIGSLTGAPLSALLAHPSRFLVLLLRNALLLGDFVIV